MANSSDDVSAHHTIEFVLVHTAYVKPGVLSELRQKTVMACFMHKVGNAPPTHTNIKGD